MELFRFLLLLDKLVLEESGSGSALQAFPKHIDFAETESNIFIVGGCRAVSLLRDCITFEYKQMSQENGEHTVAQFVSLTIELLNKLKGQNVVENIYDSVR